MTDEKIDARTLSAAEFDAAIRGFDHREHWAREKAFEADYLAKFLDQNPDLRPKPAEPTEAAVKTHTELALREKQDHSALGQYLRRSFPGHSDWYARKHGLPTESPSSAAPDGGMTDEQRQVADAAEQFLKSKGA